MASNTSGGAEGCETHRVVWARMGRAQVWGVMLVATEVPDAAKLVSPCPPQEAQEGSWVIENLLCSVPRWENHSQGSQGASADAALKRFEL